jgi:bacillithiol biosynthesis cysteine-adding enzyme BshC
VARRTATARENGTRARLWYNARVSGSSRSAPLRALAPAWLAGDEAARRLLPDGFRRESDRVEVVRRAASRPVLPALLAELERQNRELPASPARDRHLALLAAGSAATVVTGQQVGLFTGPAFTVYKAAGTVAAARELSRESGVPCVPVFWLQTEDHDWDEIDHCVVRGEGDAPCRIRAGGGDVHARASVSARRFDESIDGAVAALDAAVASRPDRERIVALLSRHYRSGATATAAFRGVLAELFADDGLVFLDPRTSAFAALARPLLERSIEEAAPISAALERRAREIEAAGFSVQVPVRPGSPLAFFHPDGAAGARYRIEPCGQSWRLCSEETRREIARDEVRRAIAADPLAGSTSALLRPLVQDALLPNAMYVAGPGEIAYFAEIQPLYAMLDIEPSLVAPRPSFCVTAAGDRRRLEQLGTTLDCVAGPRDAVLASLAGSDDEGFDPDSVENRLIEAFAQRLDEIAPHVLAVDESLSRPLEKARESVAHTVARLVEKYRHSFLLRDRVRVERVDRVRAALAPDGVPQERTYGFASLAAEHGLDALMDAVRAAAWPLEGRAREISL